ncbi:MAG: acyl-CoA dehydrogenase family protein, partial [Ilumatobacteraceae bacterium]
GEVQRHMDFRVTQGDTKLRCVAWGMADRMEELMSAGGDCCLAFTPKVNEWNGARAKAAAATGSSSPLASLGKLAMAIILHYAGHLQGELLGMEGTLDGDQNPRARDANYSQLNAYFHSIGGGTDQIQRNIIGERILGLPKEPETDRVIPFKDVPVKG